MGIDMSIPGLAFPKGLPRRIEKGRQDRKAAKVVKSVREQCVERDGDCRLGENTLNDVHAFEGSLCAGPSQWCHMHVKRRSQTRGQAPEVRHTTADSFMGCKRHHDEYDAHKLRITALTRNGADGRLKFSRAKTKETK